MVVKSTTFFLSGSTINRLKLRGFHPLCAIALLALPWLPKLTGNALLTRGTMSVGSNLGAPHCFMYSCFAFVKFILKAPFIPLASPTCHKWVAYGMPKQHFHSWEGLQMYHKNGSIILLWWPSSSRKGLAME